MPRGRHRCVAAVATTQVRDGQGAKREQGWWWRIGFGVDLMDKDVCTDLKQREMYRNPVRVRDLQSINNNGLD